MKQFVEMENRYLHGFEIKYLSDMGVDNCNPGTLWFLIFSSKKDIYLWNRNILTMIIYVPKYHYFIRYKLLLKFITFPVQLNCIFGFCSGKQRWRIKTQSVESAWLQVTLFPLMNYLPDIFSLWYITSSFLALVLKILLLGYEFQFILLLPCSFSAPKQFLSYFLSWGYEFLRHGLNWKNYHWC